MDEKCEELETVMVEMTKMSLRPAEVSRIINVSQNSLCAWRKKGIGPAFVRLSPRVIRYRPEDVIAYLRTKADTLARQIEELSLKHPVECVRLRGTE